MEILALYYRTPIEPPASYAPLAITVAVLIVLIVACLVLSARWPKIAVIAVPSGIIPLAMAAAAFAGPLGAVATVAAMPLSLLMILMTRTAPDIEEIHHQAARYMLWVCFGLLVFLLTAPGIHPLASPVSLLFLFAVLALLVRDFLRRRDAATMAVFSTLHMAMRQKLPLIGALKAAAAHRNDSAARIMQRLAGILETGRSLCEALDMAWTRCPAGPLAAIAAAEGIGQLPRALENIVEEISHKGAEDRKVRSFAGFYPVAIFGSLLLVLSGLTFFVMPRYETIFAKMGRELPWLTRIVMDHHGWAVLILVPIGGAGLLTAGVVCIHAWVLPRFAGRQVHVYARIVDRVRWLLPGSHSFQRDSSLARVAARLRMALSAGCPVDEAIERSAGVDINSVIRQRMWAWVDDVRRGDDVAAAARKNRVGDSIAWAFDAVANPTTTLEALAALERFHRANYAYRRTAVLNALWPLTVVAMGAAVGLVVIALFLPLVEILKGVG